jgi:SAM-dependent methyltransferase
MDFIASHSPGRALDLGCGTGTNVITLAQHGWQATGVDFVRKAIDTGKRKARQAGVQVDLRLGDVVKPNGIAAPFDLILDIGCFQSLAPESKREYIRNLTDLLALYGTYLMYGFFKLAESDRFGLTSADLGLLGESLDLVKRQDGTERGRRPSAWFTYRRKAIEAQRMPSSLSDQNPKYND